MSLVSLQLERHTLNGIINNPSVFPEVERFLSENCFTSKVHSVIFSCIKSLLLDNKQLDKVLIAQSIKNLGISFAEDLDIFSYVESICFSPITLEATIEASKELIKLKVLRDLEETCHKIENHVNKSANQDLSRTIVEVDALYGEKINQLEQKDESISLFEDLWPLAQETASNPQEEIGISTPYPEFNRLFGGFRNKNLYIIAARAKAGKSNWIDETAYGISKFHKIPVLILDTELSTKEVQFRAMASVTGVGLWYLETGKWAFNKTLHDRVSSSLKDIAKDYQVTHLAIGNRKIEEILSIARHWYLKKVGRGNKCLICFDYLKIVEFTGNKQEYQLMGDKVDALKKLSEELDCPVLTAVQSNRSGITTNRDVSELVDDESSIGISDRISWYASFVAILRRKVSEEIILDSPESGTHKMIPLVSRWLGRDASGHSDLILRTFPDGKKKWIKNYINFNIDNFKVDERGSLRDAIIRQNASFKAIDKNSKNDVILE
jgi:replicative DNA helicase